MFWANILLATLTLVLAGIAAWQAKLTQDSVIIARDSSKAAVKSAEDSTQLATDTLAVAKDSSAAAAKSAAAAEQALKSQRAYITVGSWNLKSPMESGEPIAVTCVFQNAGPTQAIIVSSNVTTYIGKRLPPEPKYKTLHDEGMVALGSQQTFLREFRHTAQLASDQFEAIQSGTQTFFTFGFVEYEDVFHQRQKSAFCVHYDPETKRLNQCAQRNYHESWPTQNSAEQK